jgi:hypothetical protein
MGTVRSFKTLAVAAVLVCAVGTASFADHWRGGFHHGGFHHGWSPFWGGVAVGSLAFGLPWYGGWSSPYYSGYYPAPVVYAPQVVTTYAAPAPVAAAAPRVVSANGYYYSYSGNQCYYWSAASGRWVLGWQWTGDSWQNVN